MRGRSVTTAVASETAVPPPSTRIIKGERSRIHGGTNFPEDLRGPRSESGRSISTADTSNSTVRPMRSVSSFIKDDVYQNRGNTRTPSGDTSTISQIGEQAQQHDYPLPSQDRLPQSFAYRMPREDSCQRDPIYAPYYSQEPETYEQSGISLKGDAEAEISIASTEARTSQPSRRSGSKSRRGSTASAQGRSNESFQVDGLPIRHRQGSGSSRESQRR